MTPKVLRDLADNLFGKRGSLMSLWQEQAENFFVERADFTSKRYLGEEFAGNLMSSFPLLCRRDLGDQIGQMLRPTQKTWFRMGPLDARREDHEARQWLEWASGTMFRAMYDPQSLFERASKEADHDFACFGQDVESVRLNRNRDGLLYRCWHLRDVAWQEDDEGKVCPIFRRWKPTVQTLVRLSKQSSTFKLDPKVERLNEKEPFTEIDCLHMVVQADMYDGDARGMPYWSIYYDCQHEALIEAVPTWNKEYAIPRWQTVSGSQYAYSPATVAALPDARLLQAMTYTLLEAGEKVTNPPLIATEGSVRSDVAVYAGGITWVEYEYDEREGAALRSMPIAGKGMPIGIDMQRDGREMIARAFYLNKLRPFSPTQDPQMTAFQAGQIVAQYIRDALPLFAPMESQKNGQVCELTFDLLLRNGAFGAPVDMPRALQGAELQFRFTSPLHDAIEEQKGQKFLQMKALAADAIAMDPNAAAIPNVIEAFRDALSGIQVPARWTRSEAEAEAMIDAKNAERQQQQMLANLQAGADIAATGAAAAKDLAPA